MRAGNGIDPTLLSLACSKAMEKWSKESNRVREWLWSDGRISFLATLTTGLFCLFPLPQHHRHSVITVRF